MTDGMGFAANIGGPLARYFFFTLMQSRTFVFSGKLEWTRDAQYCDDAAVGMECYFLPISKCSAQSLLGHGDIQQDVMERQLPGDGPYSDRRIVHVTPASTPWPLVWGDVAIGQSRSSQLR